MKTDRFLLALLALLLLLFGAGLTQLFNLRLETGDIYPPYSSLRADPVGTKGFFASLEQLRGRQARRNYEPLPWIQPAPQTTWLCLGTERESFQLDWPAQRKLTEGLLMGQSRLVIAFTPEHAPTGSAAKPVRFRPGRQMGTKEKEALPLEEAWGFAFEQRQLPMVEEVFQAVTVTRTATRDDLPEKLPWHSSLCFTNLDPAWRVLYAREGRPVIMERALGQGTLVLVADSYLFSNEALRFHRQPALLAWCLGGNATVIFDEIHLGVREQPGMGTLLRRYRLQGVLGAFLLLGILFVWKNATRLAPPRVTDRADGHVTGQDAAQGFVNLLRRELPPAELPRLCFEQWKSKLRHGSRHSADRLARMESLVLAQEQLPSRLRDPVATYQQLAQITTEKTTAIQAAKPANPPPVQAATNT